MRTWAIVAIFALLTASASGQTTPRPVPPAPEQHLAGAISKRTPRVSFPLQLQAGQIVTLTTSSAANLDTMLALNGPNGQSVAENDDVRQGALSSRIVYVARASGTYNAIVSGYGGAIGAFQLNVSFGVNSGLSSAARQLRQDSLSFDRRRTEHRFPVQLSDGDILVASTLALNDQLDTTLKLLDASGAVLAQNDDGEDGSLNSRLVYQAAAAGRYEIVASTYDGHGSGDFVLSLALDPNAEAPFNFASIDGALIARHQGELSDAHTSQEYSVNLAAGQTLLATSDAVSGDLDTVLRLSGPDGFPVAFNDDRGDGSYNSGFAYTATRAGTYRLELYRYRQSATHGAFRLDLRSVDRSVVTRLQALIENVVSLSGAERTLDTRDFRVHYTLEGADASTAAYAAQVAQDLQNAYDAQVTRLGWAAPVRDPDGRYRAYVADGHGDMGYTKVVQFVFDNPNTANVRERVAARTVIVVENDFGGMQKSAPRESLAHATAAHEFNHAIQYGYDAEEGLSWLYEATSSWIETATTGADQDATDYVDTDFAAPQMCWTTNTPGFNYAQWTLLQSLADAHGERIVRRLWENAVAFDNFETMSRTLSENGTTIPDALQRWRVQNFARDYVLAPRFEQSVHAAGRINRNGTYSPKDRIEQLGANYITLQIQGRRAFTLSGDANLELVGVGKRNGQIEATPLGRGGVFDTSGLDYAALMVFNRAIPASPGACTGAGYSIEVAPSTQEAPRPRYQFSAAHFAPPS